MANIDEFIVKSSQVNRVYVKKAPDQPFKLSTSFATNDFVYLEDIDLGENSLQENEHVFSDKIERPTVLADKKPHLIPIKVAYDPFKTHFFVKGAPDSSFCSHYAAGPLITKSVSQHGDKHYRCDIYSQTTLFSPSDHSATNCFFRGTPILYDRDDRGKFIIDNDCNVPYDYFQYDVRGDYFAIRPCLDLDILSVIRERELSDLFKISYDHDGNYHTIEFGSFPQDRAQNSQKLEKLYQLKHQYPSSDSFVDKLFRAEADGLTPTGKTYTGQVSKNGELSQNPEFEYKGKKYVRQSETYVKDVDLKSVTTTYASAGWSEVQPIKWVIKNWDELPEIINPNGSGTAQTIQVTAESAILGGIPLGSHNPGANADDSLRAEIWQNSLLRAYLNGYNLEVELCNGNGNKDYPPIENYNFEGKGFMHEAFDDELTKVSSANNSSSFEEGSPTK